VNIVKLTASKLRQIIRDETRAVLRESVKPRKRSLASLIFEDADSTKIDPKLFPTKLSQVNKELAKDLASKGPEDKQEDDDKAAGGIFSGAANTCKISQTTMDFGKFVGMAIQMLGKLGNFSGGAGGDLGAIISSDNHIMDGHHRWAGTLMVDPGASVGGLKIELPGEKLVGVLNVWTAAHGGAGKPSDTSMDSLTSDAVAAKFKEMCEKGGKFLPSPEEILKAFKANGFDSLDAATEHVKKNWESTAKLRKVEGWMPPKVDMPAIEPDQLAQVKKDIESGAMDINPPYSPEVSKAVGGDKSGTQQKAGYVRAGHVMVERWQKLAGLIK